MVVSGLSEVDDSADPDAVNLDIPNGMLEHTLNRSFQGEKLVKF